MLRIGEAAKRFELSNRTLRYWEETGILRSERAENGYRYYDSANELRIQQIALLRALQLPVAEIERIFLSEDITVAMEALTAHLERLRQESADLSDLALLTEELLRHMQTTPELTQALASIAAKREKPRLKTVLSERIFTMSGKLDNVRIVRLPAMTVAACRAESETPERDCSKVFVPFVLEHNLHKRSGYRNFGFNNPSPSAGNPVYGYELWVTIPDEFDVPAPLEKKQFSGGLYASISTRMSEIGERWRQLYQWCEKSDKYDVDFSSQWLEECSMDFEAFFVGSTEDGAGQLDLLEPVKERR
ncbi:MAG: effector binding domain-containing protein [Desulfovibrionaceae bacterium]|nr:effector binding domain-containing protein [Desulfovibrionaceae bacterium]